LEVTSSQFAHRTTFTFDGSERPLLVTSEDSVVVLADLHIQRAEAELRRCCFKPERTAPFTSSRSNRQYGPITNRSSKTRDDRLSIRHAIVTAKRPVPSACNSAESAYKSPVMNLQLSFEPTRDHRTLRTVVYIDRRHSKGAIFGTGGVVVVASRSRNALPDPHARILTPVAANESVISVPSG
jgi:hypothetical protein